MIYDSPETGNYDRLPDKIEIISSKEMQYEEFLIKKIELREYIEKTDGKLGAYSLITSVVQTDKGTIEMKYDENFHRENTLQDSKDFLVQNLGLSSLILRSIIALREQIKNQ